MIKKQRILAFVLGIVCTFTLIEVSLRVVGFFDNLDRDVVVQANKEKFKILAIGNSYTAGSGAPFGFSYPNQLNRILEIRKPGHYVVLNHGLSNVNTSFILERLPGWLEKNPPDVVFLMVGEPNYWNKYSFEKFLSQKDHSKRFDITEYLRWSKTFRWLELLRNSDNVFYSTTSSNRYSTMFKSVELKKETRALLGYLWVGALEKGFYKDQAAYLNLSTLTESQISEAETFLNYNYESEKNPVAAKILSELYLFKARKSLTPKLNLEKSLSYLEKAINSSTHFDISQRMLLNSKEFDNMPKKNELYDLMIAKISEASSIELREVVKKSSSSTLSDRSIPKTCEEIIKLAEYYPSSTALINGILACPYDAKIKLRFLERAIGLNPLSPLADLLGNGAKLAKEHPVLSMNFKNLIKELAKKIGPLDYHEKIFDENLIREWIENDLNKMIVELEKTKAKIIIQTYPPLRDGSERAVDLVLRNWWNQKKAKDNIKFMDVASLLRDNFKNENGGDRFYTMQRGSRDNHLNSEGYLEISKLMAPFIP